MLFIGWILIVSGLFFIISGIVGLFRFPDFYTKLHAASVIECCGIPMSLLGLSLMQEDITSAAKLIFIAVVIFLLNPASTYAIGRASLLYKVDQDGRIK